MYDKCKKPFVLINFGFSNFLVLLCGKAGVIYADNTFSTTISKKDKLSPDTFKLIFDRVLDVANDNKIEALNVYVSGTSHNEHLIYNELKKKNIEILSINTNLTNY